MFLFKDIFLHKVQHSLLVLRNTSQYLSIYALRPLLNNKIINKKYKNVENMGRKTKEGKGDLFTVGELK